MSLFRFHLFHKRRQDNPVAEATEAAEETDVKVTRKNSNHSKMGHFARKFRRNKRDKLLANQEKTRLLHTYN